MEKDILMKKTALLFSIVFSLQLSANTKIIYGDDNRVDVIDSTNSMYVELSRSTAAMIPASSLRSIGGGISKVLGKSLEERGICSAERFSEQLSGANCSGFLVGENLLVTAGHCITGQSSCDSYKWVFDYKISTPGQTQMNVEDTALYSCKRIINRSLDSRTQDDWALIELDRNVTDRRVLDYRRSGKISVGEDLVVIGHPTGLPTKIADGAYVKSLAGTYFSANLDTYGGNSGSAVFNANTGVIEGILVRGATDYVYDRTQGCTISNVVNNDSGRGEDVTFITNITELQ